MLNYIVKNAYRHQVHELPIKAGNLHFSHCFDNLYYIVRRQCIHHDFKQELNQLDIF